MKNVIVLFLLSTLTFLTGCRPNEICADPKPLQPSFSVSKYTVHVNESFTLTYTGPDQPLNTIFSYTYYGPNSYEFTEFGKNVTTAFNKVGSYGILLMVSNCNADKPQVFINPAITVIP